MEQPTKEQVKEFWERCGLIKLKALDGYEAPNGELTYGDIDLNNLFRYGWKKAIEKLQHTNNWTYRQAEGYLFKLWQKRLKTDNYEDALFWAIWEVIHG